MESFSSLGLPQPLLHALERMQFNTPTPIQAQAIPSALEGHDILGSAQTGTGKTAAFGIPLVARLLANPQDNALVMAPTRELAVQVLQALRELLGKKTKTALLIGGESMPKQLQQLRSHPRLVVGTPGRINDHLSRNSLKLGNTRFLVLDETDRMLDMGFAPQIEKIRVHLPAQRQTLLFSATLPKDIVRISEKYLNNPVRVSAGPSSTPAANIKQDILHMNEGEKYAQLLSQLGKREGSVLVFVKTKYGAERMAKRLRGENQSADAIHGDLRQNRRDKVIQNFRQQKHRIMVATDIAARGLDIPHIEHVINYDLPQCAEDYIHRIGRTARAGAEGEAICFVTPADKSKWAAIDRLLNPDAPRAKTPKGDAPGPKRGKKPFRFKKHKRSGGEKPRHAGQKSYRTQGFRAAA